MKAETDQQKASRLEAAARELHRRSRAAAALPSVLLRLRALGNEAAARLLRKRSR